MADTAARVLIAWATFQERLAGKGAFPMRQFQDPFTAVKAYVEATKRDDLVHRSVASCASGLRETLETQGSRAPGEALFDADRLECMLFCGCDPKFEGDGPPGQ